MIPSLFTSEPPDRDQFVLGHAVPFSPKHWIDRLPDPAMWPELLAGKHQGPGRWPHVSRQDVFDLASIKTPDAAVQFYVAAGTWGVGTKARLVGRRVRVLRDNVDPGQHLLEAVRILREDGPTAGYRAFQRGGLHRLTGLGPGFFTKLLYFAGWARSGDGRPPLILDQYVAAALNEQADLGWSLRWSWTSDQYDQYLDLAQGWADARGAPAPTWSNGRCFSGAKHLRDRKRVTRPAAKPHPPDRPRQRR